ncbi:MAG TPA: tRNA-(ms[2]io[6]A)-hydroxylase [Chitinophagales bacterium]|nr:tRNA-(ms[2]io[6]A)-hydroxylase [Chitinophagales bacterium]HMX05085.1 tRNA-(ms[2]io[6]A)-hydroxylase [Chitinophagales bacterium]HNA58730.1 tRNA-(ms[2]io[6]A)-hydroxylase [Chitinophagales bacterium]HNE47439.1 tRNA-(ms[2]io[6]A)-hydroxylase [Chitinophagales bacterium]HNM30351.1 tRNA-(ms[2]io[6]A)-hydroxylase [Chitinophagales bacterium]
MLGLKLPTDPRWVNLAEKSLEEILTDHAYCEQKAASSCISIIQLFPEYERVVDEVSPVVTEEWAHFRLVLKELKDRGLKLGKQRSDRYVHELSKFQLKGGTRQQQLLEKLLMAAMIEARSCERFRLLSVGLSDEKLRQFYHGFMVSEAGHYRMFLDLANAYIDSEIVKTRWQQWLDYEAELMTRLLPDGKLMH